MAAQGEALEADFHRFYQLDLADLWRGSLSPRKAAVLAVHLPPEAAIYRQGPDDRLWSLETQMLASIIDLIRQTQFAWANAKVPPEPLPRPGDYIRAAQKALSEESKEAIAERRMRLWQERQQSANQ